MRLSMFRTGIVAAAAAIALAACGGHGMVPSQGGASGFSPNVLAASPCQLPGTWYFKGSCAVFQMSPKGGSTVTLPLAPIASYPNT